VSLQWQSSENEAEVLIKREKLDAEINTEGR
jgi:hypothetical protein